MDLFPSAQSRMATLEAFPLSAAERAALLANLEQLVRALHALDAFVEQTAEPATGFDPLLGDEG